MFRVLVCGGRDYADHERLCSTLDRLLANKLANLVRDREWLIRARNDAQELLRIDPDLTLPSNAMLRRYFEREGRVQFDRLKTS
jgi:hypothetical protein